MRAIDDIITDFEFLDNWGDRYQYVIELGRELPDLPPTDMNADTKVPGCLSQVWLVSRIQSRSPIFLSFSGQSDSDIVRGLVAIILSFYSKRNAQEVIDADVESLFDRLHLRENFTQKRSNALPSMVARIRNDARAALEAA